MVKNSLSKQSEPIVHVIEQPDLSQVRASEGFVKGFAAIDNPYLAPNPDYSTLATYLDLYQKDSIIAGAIDTVAEEAIKNRGYFIGSDSAISQAEELFEELDFYNKAEVEVRTKHIFGDSFMELRFDEGSGDLIELNNLETTEMFIGYDKHGKIEFFQQRPYQTIGPNMDSQPGKNLTKLWMPSDIIFTKLKSLGSKVRSYAPLDPASASITARLYSQAYITNVFKNFKPQTIYSIENNVSPEQTKALVAAIRASDKDPGKKLLTIGELKVQTSGMYEFRKDLVDILNYMRQEILTVTKVPGIYVGITDGSNRGVSEMEATAFQTHLLRLQRDIEMIGDTVLEAAGINATFKCKPPSIKSQTDVIDQAKKLRDMGYGDDVITKFLYENGINIPQNATFEQENTVSMSDMPSRVSGDKGVTEGKYSLDSNGRSEKGKAKSASMDKIMRGASQKISFDTNLTYLRKTLGI
jgi:hypothetical protein